MKYFILLFLFLLLFYFILNNNFKKGFEIDKIIYINLDHRTDRKKEVEDELDKFNLKYERFSAISNKNGALGCSKSHLAVIKKAKENNYKNILVLEDDFDFIVSKDQFYNEIDKLSQASFDVCLLAYNTPNLYDSSYPFLHKIKDAQTTSGYIVQSHYYDTLIAQWEYAIKMFEETNDDTKYTCDQSWKPLQNKDNWYCFKTRIGKQRKSYSDIQKGVIDSVV
jgi:glycosyl transferase family 25